MLTTTRLATATRVPYLLAGIFFLGYATYSVSLHHAFQTTGFDLGIFEQAVRSYAEGRWPTSDLKGPGYLLLGDHFHPMLAVLAPFYALVPTAETLLVAQAALLAVSVIPVTRIACRVLGASSGTLVGIGYGLSWGLLRAVSFDFHEVAFAVPLLAFALESLMLQRFRRAVAWALPLLLVKEDLPLTVAMIGLYLCWQGKRRLGAGVAVLGVLTSVVLVAVVLPAINVTDQYDHWKNLHGSSMSVVAGLAMRAGTVVSLLAPTACLALRSPLLLLAAPTLAWRFLSTNPHYWGTGFHYSAVLMPIVFVAFVDGLDRLGADNKDTRRRLTAWAAPASLAVTVLLFVVHLAWPPGQPQWTVEQQAAARRVLATIPDGASVAAANRLAPQLTNRCRVFLYPDYPARDYQPEWLAVTRPVTEDDYRVVADLGHILLLRRDP